MQQPGDYHLPTLMVSCSARTKRQGCERGLVSPVCINVCVCVLEMYLYVDKSAVIGFNTLTSQREKCKKAKETDRLTSLAGQHPTGK